MIKLLNILREAIDLESYLLNWMNSGALSVNKDIPHSFVLELGKQGYKKYGTIYRCIFLKRKEIAGMDNNNLKNFIWKKYKGNYTSFSSEKDGAEWFATAMSRDIKIPIIIKQESEYYDVYQWYEDNKHRLGKQIEFEEIEDTHECISTLNRNFKIIKLEK
jgi:hypothetical protein